MPPILTNKSADNDDRARVVSAKHAGMLTDTIAAVAKNFVSRNAHLLPDPPQEELSDIIRDFFRLYDARPIHNNSGGTKFNDSLWLYTLTCLLKPQKIIESGTHQGHSSWILHKASPNAEIECFDITLANLRHREPDIRYHEMDWSKSAVRANDPDASLCYFDDHTNQARRVREAYDRGFRTLIFDDNRSASTLYGTGAPPVPTIDMLFDDSLAFGDTIEWYRHGKSYQYTFTAEETFGAKNLIEGYATTPDLAQVTRYSPQSGMTIVRLVA